MDSVTRFLDFLDKRQVFRRLAFLAVLWGTIRITDWAISAWYVWMASNKSGIEAAAFIAAVTAPFSVLQGAVIKFYFESKK